MILYFEESLQGKIVLPYQNYAIYIFYSAKVKLMDLYMLRKCITAELHTKPTDFCFPATLWERYYCSAIVGMEYVEECICLVLPR